MVLDAQGRLVELNRAGEELTGYSAEEIRGRKLWDSGLVPEEEKPGTREVFARLHAGDFPNRYENHWITRDGRWRLLSWRNSAVLDEYGEVSRVIGAAVDVTDERRALDALQESAERFRATLQTLVDPLVLLTAARDADGTVVDFVYAFANEAACAVHGVAREELIGRHLLGFLPGARSSGLFDAFVRVIETGEPFSRDDLVFAVGGGAEETERRLIVRVTSVGDQVAVTWIDATERRRVEARVEAGEQRFDAALGSMLDSVTIVSPARGDDGEIVDFRYEYVNDAHCALVGFNREQLLGHRLGELFPQYPGSDRFEVYRRVAVTGEPCRTDDVHHEGAWAGTPLATRVVDTIIASMGEDLVVSARDVTERRRSEEALRLRAELLDLAHDAVIVRDPAESRVTFWNREAQAIYGYSPAEALGQVTHELLATVFPESRQAVDHALGRDGRWVGELRHTRRDGGVIVVSSRQALQRAADGQPAAIIELNSDITERKLVEVELRRLAAGVDSSADAIFSKDCDCRITSWNRGAERLYGYNASEIVGQPVSVLVPADRAGEEQGILDRALRGEDVGRYETKRLAKDGTVIDVSITVSPIYGTSGDVFGASSIHRDITERKRAEEELARIAGLLERTEEISKTGGWEFDVATGELTWTDEVYRIYGVERTSDPTEVTQAIAAYDPESAPIIDAAFKRLVAEGVPYDLELGLLRADGQRIWVHTIGRQVIDDGRVVRVGGNISDVTERKRIEEALRASDQLFHSGFDDSPTGMALTGLDGRLVEVNAAFARMLGFDDPAQLAGQDFARFTHPDDVAANREGVRMMVEERKPYVAEKRYIRRDGGVVGGIKRSSQHLDREELRWAGERDGRRVSRGGRRCVRRVTRRAGAGSIACGSGRRSLEARRARPLVWRQGSRPRLASDGFERVAECRRSPRRRCRDAICRLPSGRRLRCCAPAGAGCGTSGVWSAARPRRSRGSFVVMPPRAAAGWSIGRRVRSGMPTVARRARSRRSWPSTRACGSMCRSVCRARSSGRTGVVWRVRMCGGSAGATAAARIGGGRARGALSRSRLGCSSSSRMMSRCGSRTRRSTRRCTCRAVEHSGASSRHACGPAGRCASPGRAPAVAASSS